jgi:hypothetical protein
VDDTQDVDVLTDYAVEDDVISVWPSAYFMSISTRENLKRLGIPASPGKTRPIRP